MRFKDYDKQKLIVRLPLADRIRNVFTKTQLFFPLGYLTIEFGKQEQKQFSRGLDLWCTGCKLFENLKNKEKAHMCTQYTGF